MATRFDAFNASECNIIAASLAVYRDSYWALMKPGSVNGGAPSRDALLTEIQGASNWPGKHVDVIAVGGNPRKQ